MQLADLTWPEVKALPRDTPIVFPVAALEQHGHHLPLFTDSLLLGEIVRRAEPALRDRILFAPLQWLGNSDHHLDFPGTLSAPPRAYLDVLNGMIDNALQHGFRRIVFINGHGGNDVPGRQAVFEARQRHRQRDDLLLLFATYWHLAQPAPEHAGGFRQKEMGHACEWETSMILRLAPHLVRPHTDRPTTHARTAFGPAGLGWVTQDFVQDGHIGDASAATVEKGEILFSTFANGLVGFLSQVAAWDGRSWN
jgi:creatinine amidohydrolase